MKKTRSLHYILILSCVLLNSCDWLENKKEQAEQKISEEIDEHVLEPIAEGIYEIGEEIFNPPYDSLAAEEYCAELRPNPLRVASLQDISEIGYQNSVLANTPDSILPHIDASFFKTTNTFFPLKFPYVLEYSGVTLDYFHIELGYCQFSDLPYQSVMFVCKEIFQLAMYEQYLMIITYDDDLSFMSPTRDGIKYYILNLNNHEHYEYFKQEDFDIARHDITNSNDSLMSPTDFIKWYETYSLP